MEPIPIPAAPSTRTDLTVPSTAPSSVITDTTNNNPPPAIRVLEISLISAQDLAPLSKSMRTYAVAWIQADHKQSTRVDQKGHTNPTWNDKFAFHVDDDFLFSEDAAVRVEIYSVTWLRDVLVGTVRVLISNLITPQQYHSGNMRYVALQIRRPSGSPQGILNMGVSLVDTIMSLCMPARPLPLDFREIPEKKTNKQSSLKERAEDDKELHAKVQLWRSLSLGSDDNNEEFPVKSGSVNNGSLVNGSMVNGSELCSDIGPSASIVAAEIAQKSRWEPPPIVSRRPAQGEESESCILEDMTEEEAAAKGLTRNASRMRKDGSFQREEFNEIPESTRAHSRRHSDGGLFSCFGNAYGFEVRIVCGANNGPKPVHSKTKKKSREANST